MCDSQVALVEEVLHEGLAAVQRRLVVHVPGRAAQVAADGFAGGAEALGPLVAELVVGVLDGLGVEGCHAVAADVVLRHLVRVVEEAVHRAAASGVHHVGGLQRLRREQLGQARLHLVLVLVHHQGLLADSLSVLLRADIVTELIAAVRIFGSKSPFTTIKRLGGDVFICFLVALRHIDNLGEVAILRVNRDKL